MIKIQCRTNLDLDMNESFPTELPAMPRVGDLIESSHEWIINNPGTAGHGAKTKLQLEVCRTVWKHRKSRKYREEDGFTEYNEGKNIWYAEVELSLPRTRYGNMDQFYEWYGRVTGRGKHAFI